MPTLCCLLTRRPEPLALPVCVGLLVFTYRRPFLVMPGVFVFLFVFSLVFLNIPLKVF